MSEAYHFSVSNLIGLWKAYHDNQFPGQRFGQLVINHFHLATNPDLFYAEDDQQAFMLAVELLAELE